MGVHINLFFFFYKSREKQSLTVHFIRVENDSLKVDASLMPGVKGQNWQLGDGDFSNCWSQPKSEHATRSMLSSPATL